MQPNLLMAIILPILLSCSNIVTEASQDLRQDSASGKKPSSVGGIAVPEGYTRVKAEKGSFAEWLRNIRLKNDNTVYLFNGLRKSNQSAQFAVLDISVGNKDLQQCADAIMRLRSEYLWAIGKQDSICFKDNNGKQYRPPVGCNRAVFNSYLERVFSFCGTLSLEKQLQPRSKFDHIAPGDVLIKGGSPGHAAIVLDVAINSSGNKIFLLANGYMPAQDIHVLKNPSNSELSPWYSIDNSGIIELPEWRFYPSQLRTW